MALSNVYILTVIVIYLVAFFIRNLKTATSTKTSIRGKSLKLTISLVLATIIYLMTLVLLFYPIFIEYLGRLSFLEILLTKYAGYVLIFIALLVGIAALIEMRNSWRVGIKHDQKTDLVTTGIYSLSRNPYFLSYILLFIGIFLIFPSIILLLLVIGLITIFHRMILEEEVYLEKVQGEAYIQYKKRVRRYL